MSKLSMNTAHTIEGNKKMASGIKSYKKLSDIPGPTAIPFFGTTLFSSGFGGKDLRKSNEEHVTKYGQLVKQEHFWNYPILEVFDPDDIDKILRADRGEMIRPPCEILTTYRQLRKDKYVNVGLVNAIGDEWFHLKHSLTKSLLSNAWISEFLPHLNEIGDDMIHIMRDKGTHLYDFDDILERVAAESSCHLTLGRRVGLLGLDENPKIRTFMNSINNYFNALHNSNYGFPMWKFLPTKIWTDFVASEDAMYDIAEELTQETIDGNYEDGFMNSFLRSDEVHHFDKVAHVVDFLAAGFQTAANSLIFTVHWIAKFEDVQRKLQEELCRVLPEKDSLIDEEALNEMPYLKACIKEAFRFTPVSPNIVRLLENEVELQGYNIPAYTLFVCQTWYNCMQEKNFYRAKEFLPERWLRDRNNGEKFWPHRESVYRHFGYGKRMCPGKRFATKELYVLVAKIFRNYRLETLHELEYNYEFLLSPQRPFSVKSYELPQ